MKKFFLALMMIAVATLATPATAAQLRIEDLARLVIEGGGFTYDSNARIFNFGRSGTPMHTMTFPSGWVVEYNGGDGQRPIIGRGKPNGATVLTWNGGWVRFSPEAAGKFVAMLQQAKNGQEVKIPRSFLTNDQVDEFWSNYKKEYAAWQAAQQQAPAATATSGWQIFFPNGATEIVPIDTSFPVINGATWIKFASGQLAGQQFPLEPGTKVEPVGAVPAATNFYTPGTPTPTAAAPVPQQVVPTMPSPATPQAATALKPKTLSEFRQLGQVEALSGTSGMGWKFFPNAAMQFIVGDTLIKVDCDFQDQDGKWHAARPGTTARVEFSGTLWFKKSQK